MSKISIYEVVPIPKLADKLIGTSVGGIIEDITYNFTLQELLNLFIPNLPTNTLQSVLNNGNTATQDINLFGTITTTNLDVTNTANLFITYLNEEVHIVGGLFDSSDSIGTPGQVLTSTGSGVDWYTIPVVIPNLQQVLTSGNTADVDILLNANIEALDVNSDTATINNNITIDGTLTDGTASVGTSGKVLSSTVTGVQWVDLPIYSATSPLFFNPATGVFSIQVANAVQSGYLTSADWITFDGKQNAGNYITALTGEATASGPGSVPITLNNASVIAKVLTGLNVTGGTVTATDSILTGFGKVQNQINGLIGGSIFQGVWNASTNNPALVSSVGTNGWYYIVNVAGSTNLNGITDWQVGDWAIFAGTVWQKVDNTDAVSSVNGFTGAVNLTTDDLPEGTTNLYYLDSRARTALSATSPLLYDNTTGVFSIQIANASQNGYLSSTDWTTFNDKQNYLNGTGLVKSTAGTISYITDNSSNWNTAYNDSIVSAAVTGTSTKTLTLNQQDAGTITASWTDLGLTSVGLTMPSAFSVANSPLTSNGTLAVTGAGLASQYVRGDGTLANFPTNGGGGSSVSYYMNGSINQGTFGGNTYYEMNKIPVIGAGTDFTIAADGYIAQFITDVNDPAQLLIPGGNFNFEMYFSASSSGGTPSFYIELYKYDGVVFTLLGSSSISPEGITNGTAIDIYNTAVSVPETVLTITDRLAIRVYVTHSGRTITLHTEDNHLCQMITTFATGLTALNGLTKQVQYFAVGTTGTDFNIVSSIDTHTFNLPTASATNRGALSSANWTTFNNKQDTITLTTTGTSGVATFIANTLNIPNYADGGVLSLSAIGSTPNANAATITGTVLNLQPADASFGGVVTTGTQTFAGAKTFNVDIIVNSIIIGKGSGNIIYNTVVGGDVLFSNTTGNYNTVSGFQALYNNLGGDYNTSKGFQSMFSNTNGSSNTSVGANSLPSNTLGNNNTAIGRYAGYGTGSPFNNTTGSNNIFIGYQSVGISATESNRTWIGNSSTLATWVGGNLLVGTTANSTFALDVTGTARITGQITLGSTITDGTYTYTLPGATGTIALVGGAGVGTVTSVAALTLGTTGTDLSSTVANSTTTPVITLNVPTASASNRGALSSTDWTTFNGKESTLTFSSPLVRTVNTISIPVATTSVNGYLSSTDWTTFNNKAAALSGTINTIAYWNSATTISSLALATYPSLTELSYVKGVTSAIQTQLNAKQATITLTTTGTSGVATFSSNTLNIPNYGSALSAYLPLAGGTMSGAITMGTSGTNYVRMGVFPNSTSNSGEAWIGRASDRNSGTMTVQLGGGTSVSRSFEVVDYAWTAVLFSVSGAGAGTFSSTVTAPTFVGALTGNASTATAAQNATFLTQPNATWGARIQLGGNGGGSGVANIAVVQATDGNIHLDNGLGKSMYLNYYHNGIIYLNGSTYTISANGSQYNGNAATATSASTASTAGTVTHNASRTDVAWYNAVWAAGTPSPMYSCNSVQIQSSTGAIRANIFPFLNSTNGAALSGDGSWGFKSITSDGYIWFGPANGGHAHIYTDRPSFYFNKDLLVNGVAVVTNSGTWGISISGTAANTSSISSAVGGAYDWTGVNHFRSNMNTAASNPSLQAYSDNASGAIMSFHRGGYYAVNMGLDSDNVFRIGGWSAPANLLQLDMSGNLTLAATINATTYYQPNTSFYFTSNSGSYGAWFIGGTKNGYSGFRVENDMQLMIHGSGAGGPCGFYHASVGWSILTYVNADQRLYSNGAEKIATTGDGGYITGNLYVTGNVYANYSDIRLKKDVEVIKGAISKIKQLRGVTYTWNDEQVNILKERAGIRDIGLIAQEVQSIEPLLTEEYKTRLNTPSKDPKEAANFISEVSEAYMTVKYEKLVALLVEGIKEQQLQIEELKQSINNLSN